MNMYEISGQTETFTADEIKTKVVAKEFGAETKVRVQGTKRWYEIGKHSDFKDDPVISAALAEKPAAEVPPLEPPPREPEVPTRPPTTPETPPRERRPDRPGEEGLSITEKMARREARVLELQEQLRAAGRPVPARWRQRDDMSPGAKLGLVEREIVDLETKLAAPASTTPTAPSVSPTTPPVSPTPVPERPTPDTPEPERDNKYLSLAGWGLGIVLGLIALVIIGVLLYKWVADQMEEDKPDVVESVRDEVVPKEEANKHGETLKVPPLPVDPTGTTPSSQKPPTPTGPTSADLEKIRKDFEVKMAEQKKQFDDARKQLDDRYRKELDEMKAPPAICGDKQAFMSWAANVKPPIDPSISANMFETRCH